MLSLAAIFLFCLSYWIHRYFGQVDIHQIAYHLNFGLDIARSSDPVFTKRFVRWCVIAPLLFFALFCFLQRRLAQGTRQLLPPILLGAAIGFWLWDISAFKFVDGLLRPQGFRARSAGATDRAARHQLPRVRAGARHQLDHRGDGRHPMRGTT